MLPEIRAVQHYYKNALGGTMTQAQKDRAIAIKQFVLNRDKHCQYPGCNKPAKYTAHMISKSKMNLSKYGEEIVHHPKLLRGVCENQTHNDYFNIGFRPAEIDVRIKKIKEEGIEKWY